MTARRMNRCKFNHGGSHELSSWSQTFCPGDAGLRLSVAGSWICGGLAVNRGATDSPHQPPADDRSPAAELRRSGMVGTDHRRRDAEGVVSSHARAAAIDRAGPRDVEFLARDGRAWPRPAPWRL